MMAMIITTIIKIRTIHRIQLDLAADSVVCGLVFGNSFGSGPEDPGGSFSSSLDLVVSGSFDGFSDPSPVTFESVTPDPVLILDDKSEGESVVLGRPSRRGLKPSQKKNCLAVNYCLQINCLSV